MYNVYIALEKRRRVVGELDRTGIRAHRALYRLFQQHRKLGEFNYVRSTIFKVPKLYNFGFRSWSTKLCKASLLVSVSLQVEGADND